MEKYLDAFEKYANKMGWDHVIFSLDDYFDWYITVTLRAGKNPRTSDFIFEIELPDDMEEMLMAIYEGLYNGRESWLDTTEPLEDWEEEILDHVDDTLANINMIYDFLDSAA